MLLSIIIGWKGEFIIIYLRRVDGLFDLLRSSEEQNFVQRVEFNCLKYLIKLIIYIAITNKGLPD